MWSQSEWKTKGKAILIIWSRSVFPDFALSVCFTIQSVLNTSPTNFFTENTSPAFHKWPTVRTFSKGRHLLFRDSKELTERAKHTRERERERETSLIHNYISQFLYPATTCHMDIHKQTSAYEHANNHVCTHFLFFTITPTHCTYCTLWRTQGAINYQNGQF